MSLEATRVNGTTKGRVLVYDIIASKLRGNKQLVSTTCAAHQQRKTMRFSMFHFPSKKRIMTTKISVLYVLEK